MQGHTRNLKTATVTIIAAIAVAAVLIGPSAVLAKSDSRSDRSLTYSRSLRAASGDVAKFKSASRDLAGLKRTTPRRATEIPAPRVATSTRTLTTVSTGATTSGTTSSGGTSELAQAQSILAGYISRYPILSGTTVSIGATPGGHQAVAYYTAGRILISPSHTASLQTILGHEIWHVIDYRDNGRIDWGESVPPSNYP